MPWCESFLNTPVCFNGTSEHQVTYEACLQARWERKHNPSSHKLLFYHKWPDWWSFHMLSKKCVLLCKQTCFSLNSLLVISLKTFQASYFFFIFYDQWNQWNKVESAQTLTLNATSGYITCIVYCSLSLKNVLHC